jgi:hypothetical protein
MPHGEAAKSHRYVVAPEELFKFSKESTVASSTTCPGFEPVF